MIFRKNEVVSLCDGKSVLHLGHIHQSNYQDLINSGDWLHSSIAEVAKDLVGIDFLEKEVLEVEKKYGYEGYYADVMNLDRLKLGRIFDVIVCGELINSVENIGLMLNGLKRFMHSDSIILLTTPNPYSITRILKVIFGKTDELWIYPTAVSWQSYGSLHNLSERCGFSVSYRGYYTAYGYSGSVKNKIRGMLPPRLRDGLFFTCKINNEGVDF